MPKRTDIKSILVIGSGPIIIGQACEFDYSGTQACLALKEEGYRVCLINSNPATIMTDKFVADKVFIEPITIENIKKIVLSERIDAILPTVGGQTALNIISQMYKNNDFSEMTVSIIGVKPEVIELAEDRKAFQNILSTLGLKAPKGYEVTSVKEARKKAQTMQFPVIVRASFTLGGKGSGIAHTPEELDEIIKIALEDSPIHQARIEQSIIGWKEYEMEVVRDSADNCMIVCSIENIDPMGVHTGDSITVAPALTLTDKEYQKMRQITFQIIRGIGVDTGGANVQFAVRPETGEMLVIEMNPRVSRSSALASKATGYPIARVAAKIAIGMTLDEIPTFIGNAAFEPSIDYVVTKIPRFDFEKFYKGTPHPSLSTYMQSIGEVMAIGVTFQESLQKALRSLEKNIFGLNLPDLNKLPLLQVRHEIKRGSSLKLFYIAEAFRRGMKLEEVALDSLWDKWFLRQIQQLVLMEKELGDSLSSNDSLIRTLQTAKHLGFSDQFIGVLTSMREKEVRAIRYTHSILPSFQKIDTCAGEFPADNPCFYSSYPKYHSHKNKSEVYAFSKKSIVIIGSGPNQIGQGIEFDYCCVNTSRAVKDLGYDAVMINCNPETVSTDTTISTRLYFSPLVFEDIFDIIQKEKSLGEIEGIIIQCGGQASLKLADQLYHHNIPILGTDFGTIDLTENRGLFRTFLEMHGYKQPQNYSSSSSSELLEIIDKIKLPVILRPSYVIGGKSMEIILSKGDLSKSHIINDFQNYTPVLVEEYLSDAIEIEVDAIGDGEECYIAGLIEQFEPAGIHSGDSVCVLPHITLTTEIVSQCIEATKDLVKKLNIKGFLNIQFALCDKNLYILEVNARASRNIPFLSKATDLNLTEIATQVILGKKIKEFTLGHYFKMAGYALKKPKFSFKPFHHIDATLGPEMLSTGEEMLSGESLQAVLKTSYSHNPLLNQPSKNFLFYYYHPENKTTEDFFQFKEKVTAFPVLCYANFNKSTKSSSSFQGKEILMLSPEEFIRRIDQQEGIGIIVAPAISHNYKMLPQLFINSILREKTIGLMNRVEVEAFMSYFEDNFQSRKESVIEKNS